MADLAGEVAAAAVAKEVVAEEVDVPLEGVDFLLDVICQDSGTNAIVNEEEKSS